MIIYLDNNIVLDAMLEREPHAEQAKQILRNVAGVHTGCFSTNSLTNVFYVLRKAIGAAKAKVYIERFVNLVEIVSVDKEDCINALSLPIDDFKDALVIVCAKKAGVDCIVTRDEKLLRTNSLVAAISPGKLLERINQSLLPPTKGV